jgi:flavin reductase (DIM6/NTAB) family NADH-FMN oxidoreductase RutF
VELERMVNKSQYQKQVIPLETEDDGYPVMVPSIAVLISYVDENDRRSITPIVAWTVIARFPFTVAIGLCNGNYSENYFPRHSWKVISKTREFVLNFPHSGLCDAISAAGDVSSNDPNIDKFALTGLTPGPSKTIRSPIIMECPISLECKVTEIVHAGSHDLFIATVSAIQSDPVLQEKIEDEIMFLEVLRPNSITGLLEKNQLLWKTLPDLVVPKP